MPKNTMALSYRKNARHRNPKENVVRKAVCNKTKRKTKNEMAGWRVHGPEKYGNKRMERQSKGSRDLEAYCKGGQGPPLVVAPPKKKKELLFVIMWFVTGWQEMQVTAADRFASCHNGRDEWEAAGYSRCFEGFTLFLDYSSLSSESKVKIR